MNDNKQLEDSVLIIKPSVIIHLAAISSSSYAFNNPLETLKVNGMITAYLCDIIWRHKLGCKFFNASSIDIYKGHVNYFVHEDDHNMYHSHPYTIAKIMAHNIVEFYRDQHKLPFSNGVFSTIESSLKHPDFLLNKVSLHAKQWSQTKSVLNLGPLCSYRNILHAVDAAKAIKLIIKQNEGASYIISNDENILVYDLVKKIYAKHGINIIQQDNIIYDQHSTKIVACIENKHSVDYQSVNIHSCSAKLKQLGWNITMTINDIINETG